VKDFGLASSRKRYGKVVVVNAADENRVVIFENITLVRRAPPFC